MLEQVFFFILGLCATLIISAVTAFICLGVFALLYSIYEDIKGK